MKISHVHSELPKILTRWPLPCWVQRGVCPSGCFCWCIYKAASDPQPSHLHRQLAQQVFFCRSSPFHSKTTEKSPSNSHMWSLGFFQHLHFGPEDSLRMILMSSGVFTHVSFQQTRSRSKCVCVLIVSSTKRGALLLHVRLRVWMQVWDTAGRAKKELCCCEMGLNALHWSPSNVVWPFTSRNAISDHVPASFYLISPLSAIITLQCLKMYLPLQHFLHF